MSAVAVYKDKQKDREHKTDGMSLERANIATATKQKPRQTEKSDRMHRARKPAEELKEAGMY